MTRFLQLSLGRGPGHAGKPSCAGISDPFYAAPHQEGAPGLAATQATGDLPN